MKNHIIIKSVVYIILSSALLSLPSCEDFLTKTPLDNMSDAGYWKNENDVNAFMSGIYRGVNTALNGSIHRWGDERTDNLFPNVYGNAQSTQLQIINTDDGAANWNGLYTVISRCNMAIHQISGMTGLDETSRNSYLGQCYGLRALMYFYIVRLWGDAPLLTDVWDGDISTKYNSRTPVEDIVAAIESDIDQSVQLTGNTDVWRFNAGAALALKADFLAWRKRYSEIPAVYEQLNGLRQYSLVSTPEDWNKIFSDPASSSETIFSLTWVIAQETGINANRSPYSMSAGWTASGGEGYLHGKAIYMLMIRDTMDIRHWGTFLRSDFGEVLDELSVPAYTVGGGLALYNAPLRIYKYWPLGITKGTFQISTTEWIFRPPVYRYADVALLCAEALNRTGNAQDAIDIVNRLRLSRGSTVLASLTDYPEQLGSAANSRERLIMDERQFEFFREGKRWFDLLRVDWNMEVLNDHVSYLQERMGIEITGFTDTDFLMWPVHDNVITANPNIVQNKGY